MMFHMITPIENYLLGFYLVVALTLGVVGNLFVLIAAYSYHSIDSDGFSIVLIQNLAAGDVLCTLLMVLPSFYHFCQLARESNSNPVIEPQVSFSRGLCVMTGYAGYVPAESGTLLILIITAYKTCRCAAPFSNAVYHLNKTTAKVVALGVWCSAAVLTVLPMVLTDARIVYDHHLLRCVYDRSKSSFVRLSELIIVFSIRNFIQSHLFERIF